MLIKAELANISLLGCPKLKKSEIVDCEYVGAAQIVNLKRSGDILVVDVYDKKSHTLSLRFFSDGKNALLCEEWPAKEWHMKLPSSILNSRSIAASEETTSMTSEFLHGYEHSLGGMLNGFASRIYSDKQRKATERKYSKMREHFAMYPDYPDDLEDYCEKHVFEHTYIFITKLIKGKRSCVCGHCKNEFASGREVKPGDLYICPKCGLSARVRGSWVKSDITDKAQICIAHRVEGQLLFRWTHVMRVFSDGEPQYQYYFDDICYNLHLQTASGSVIYAYSYQCVMSYGWDWFRKNNGTVSYTDAHVYAENLNEVFGDSYYHVNLTEGLRDAGSFSFMRLLDNLKNAPATEYLFKLGLTKLAASKYTEMVRGESFCDVLGVSKQYLPLYREFNISRFEHEVVKASKTWVSRESFAKFKALRFNVRAVDIIDILEEMSFERFVNYFKKQKVATKVRDSARLITWYKDYISMSKSLDVDLSHKSVRFPENIKVAHDIILKRFNEIKHQIEDANFAQAVEKLYSGMNEYAQGAYRIVFPTTRGEFITEGQSLNHCVGSDSYYQNHMKGIRMVFFVRRIDEPGKPFYTMEIDMRSLKILQLYGFGDCSATTEVRKFANEFLRRLSPTDRLEREKAS